MPDRPAGTVTIHDRDVYHGVSPITKGVRYSLFVVDRDNGLGAIDGVVHEYDETAARPILEAMM